MVQPEFTPPEFVSGNTADEIHQRMMNSLPADIDDMPGGFPYDFTKPAALEKAELVQFHLVRAIMTAFPQYAWGDWLDSHGQQVHVVRHPPGYASGKVIVSGAPGTELQEGAVFCTPATDAGPSIEFRADRGYVIGEEGTLEIHVTAVKPGTGSNIKADAVVVMAKPVRGITAICNPEPIRGGTERETDSDFYGRIAAEYDNSRTFVGNDSDYVRWAKEAGAGDCIVVPAFNGPGTVKLVLVDGNGQPANEKLVQEVYNHIVSPDNRMRRLLPTACAQLVCEPATPLSISYTCTGFLYDATTDIEQIKKDFTEAARPVYAAAKLEGILRYNDIRPLLSDIPGVEDFETFLMDGGTGNIVLEKEEYPETGILDFS